MKRFICCARPISTPATKPSSSCPRLPCMPSSRKRKARVSSKFLPDENFAFPLDRLLAQISPRTRLIAVANPNNPTGTAVTPTFCFRSLTQRLRRRCWWMKPISSFTERRSSTISRASGESFRGTNLLEGLWIGWSAHRHPRRRRGTDGDGAPRRFALQRERGCARRIAGGASRSGVRGSAMWPRCERPRTSRA